MLDKFSDLELLDRWRDGDRAAGEILAKRHYQEIFDRLRRRLNGDTDAAADLAQQVFGVAVNNLDDIAVDFRRYLHGITRFKLWEHFRKDPGSRMLDSPSVRLVESASSALSVLTRREDMQLLVKALGLLSTEEQAYMMWTYVDGLTHPQIAELTGLRTAQINGRLHRARDRLRKILEEGSSSNEQLKMLDRGFDTWVLSLRRRVDHE